MTVVILLLTVFFYGHDPEVRAIIAPSPGECVQAAPQIKQHIEADSSVKSVEWACFQVNEGQKVSDKKPSN